MNNVEERSLNNIGKPEGPEERINSSVADQRRRRFVRGAAAVAPLVLTLRSGAVAAASCVGAKAVGATTNGSGKITLNGGTAAEGDACVISYQACESTTKISSGTVVGQITPGPSGSLVCADPAAKNQTVAILSSVSVTSLANLTG
jgi:hypothetical protein